MNDLILWVSIAAVLIAIVGLAIVVVTRKKPDENEQANGASPAPSNLPEDTTPPQAVSEAQAAENTPPSEEVIQPSTPVTSIPDLPETLPDTPRSNDLAQTQKMPAFRPRPQGVHVLTDRPAPAGWQVVYQTDIGLRRELNEDSLEIAEVATAEDKTLGLYIVADGMGGHEGGEIASSVTVESIKKHFSNSPPDPEENDTFEEWLQQATLLANQSVLDLQGDRIAKQKMGSTLVMAMLYNKEAHLANVGDSRAYRINETIEKITTDHSLVERLVELEQITEEEARTHPQRNVIYSTIGDKPDMQIDFKHIELQPGDRLLLCSDGLNGMVEDEQLLDISQQHADPSIACAAMIEAAKNAGGHDNITAILLQVD